MDNYRPLDITVISASDLENFLFFFRMRVYVVVSLINGKSIAEKKTHSTHGRSPRWNHRIKFPIEESAIHSTTLLFVIRQHRMWGDKDIGEVSIPVRELLDTNSNGSEHVVDYQVQSIRGKSVGTLTFSYQFRERVFPNPDATGTSDGSSHHPNNSYMINQQGMPAYSQTPYSTPPPGYINYPGGQYGGGWYPSTTPPGGYATPPGGYLYPPQQMGYNQHMH